MPTSYTAGIEDGKITTFRQYALQCVRAFVALIEMRDESLDKELPKEIVPAPYYAEQVGVDEAYLTELNQRSDKEWAAKYAEVIADTSAKNNERAKTHRDITARYAYLGADVNAWIPPTSEHQEMKNFMLEQIRISTEHSSKEPYTVNLPSFDVWKAQVLSEAKHDCIYSSENLSKQKKLAAGRNEWLQALYKSLNT